MNKISTESDQNSNELRQVAKQVRTLLLRLHKNLLETERLQYETLNGPVQGQMQFLELALNDPSFSWLRKLSQLVIAFDELLMQKGNVTSESIQALLSETKILVVPKQDGNEFQKLYFRAVTTAPTIEALEGEWQILRAKI